MLNNWKNTIKNIKTIGSDSLSIMKNRSVNANFTSKVLKKESLISDEFYLRTNFYAINGIGYEDRSSADDNFATLFAYVENELSQKFPEDTITTELVFNKTSQDIYTVFIQSVYLCWIKRLASISFEYRLFCCPQLVEFIRRTIGFCFKILAR